MRLAHGADLPAPAYQTSGAAGLDLYAALPAGKPLTLLTGEWRAVPTGIALQLPSDVEGQVRPRSGLALRHGVTVLNSPGTIDADYRGEVSVILINHSKVAYDIHRGDRIAQLVLSRILRPDLEEAGALDESLRGSGGFGSTGFSG